MVDSTVLVALIRGKLLVELKQDAFNVGVNDGPAAGQEAESLHSEFHITGEG